MRRTGALAAEVLIAACEQVRVGVATDSIDRFVHDAAVAAGAYPSPLGYRGFPKSVCTSVNEVICHGIPDSRRIADGDIINIDVTVYREGRAWRHVGDADGGRGGRPFASAGVRDPGCAVRGHRGGAGRRGGVGDRTGHPGPRHPAPPGCGARVHRARVGTEFHSGLQVPHYHDRRHSTELEVGMTFTIEPMLTLGSPQVAMWDDDWTAVTLDGRRTAQFEAHDVVHPRRH